MPPDVRGLQAVGEPDVLTTDHRVEPADAEVRRQREAHVGPVHVGVPFAQDVARLPGLEDLDGQVPGVRGHRAEHQLIAPGRERQLLDQPVGWHHRVRVRAGDPE